MLCFINLKPPLDIRTKDIEDLFYKFGKIAYIDLKNRRGPPFAFVEFEDSRFELLFDLWFLLEQELLLITWCQHFETGMLKMLFMPEMDMIMMATV